MRKVEETIRHYQKNRLSEVSKYDLDNCINKICEMFLQDGAIEWEKEEIFTAEALLNHIKEFSKERLSHGLTSLTKEDIAKIKKTLYDKYSIIQSNQIELLEKAFWEAEKHAMELFAEVSMQIDKIKQTSIDLGERRKDLK